MVSVHITTKTDISTNGIHDIYTSISGTTETLTEVRYAATVFPTRTTTDTITHVVTVASSTKTVATLPGFVPVANAAQIRYPIRKRSPRLRRRAHRTRPERKQAGVAKAASSTITAPTSTTTTPTLFPALVHCLDIHQTAKEATTTIDEYAVDYITVHKATSYQTQWVRETSTRHSTVHTDVATVYQGCEMRDNRKKFFNGNPMIGIYSGYYGSDIMYYDETILGKNAGYASGPSDGSFHFTHSGDQVAIQSDVNCCNAAFAQNCIAWLFSDVQQPYDFGERACVCVEDFPKGAVSWFFVTNGFYPPDTSDTTIGNGPIGVPLFGGSVGP